MVTPHIRLERMLGEGGMGSVWVAEHQSLATMVAVKFISEAVADNPEIRHRFTREARASAKIKSPHVVQVFDTGLVDGRVPYIVMELLEGTDLGERITKLGPRPLPEVVSVIKQACKALSKAHDAGVVHRDIKPDNLFVCDPDGDPHVKVLDFGVAKSDENTEFGMTSTGTMVGTPYYMSPEQLISAKHVDARSDLWSLGIVAYHALMGRLPFDAETFAGLVIAIEKSDFRPPFETDRVGSPELDAWFLRAICRQPANRFASAAEMAAALDDAVGNPRSTMASAPFHSIPDVGEVGQAAVTQNAISQGGSSTPGTGGTLPLGHGETLAGTATESQRGSRRGLGLAIGVGALLLIVLGIGGAIAFKSGGGEVAAEPLDAAETPAAAALGATEPDSDVDRTDPVAAPSVAPVPEPPPSASAADPTPQRRDKPAVAAPRRTKSKKPTPKVEPKPDPKPQKKTPKVEDYGF